MIINCKNWKSSDKFFRGTCLLGMFKGTPSFGECVDHCSYCQTKRTELDEYIKTLAGKQNEQPKPCGNCGQIKNIVKGFGRLAWERITKGKPDDITIKRGEICAVCDYRTFLNFAEWGINFTQDHELPINHEPGEWDALWCAKCKCCIEAKIRVENEKCPIGKWDEISV